MLGVKSTSIRRVCCPPHPHRARGGQDIDFWIFELFLEIRLSHEITAGAQEKKIVEIGGGAYLLLGSGEPSRGQTRQGR